MSISHELHLRLAMDHITVQWLRDCHAFELESLADWKGREGKGRDGYVYSDDMVDMHVMNLCNE